MRRTRIRPIGALVILLTALVVPPGQADILDDILALATAARDRATEARDRATQARDRATQARDNAAAARDTAIEMRDNMRVGFDALTVEMQTAIDEAIAALQRGIQQELAGRDDFLASGAAEPFRQNLILLLQRSETVINKLFDIAGAENMAVDFSRAISVIESLPETALYPLYRVLAVELNLFEEGGLLDRLDQAVVQLELICEALNSENRTREHTGWLDGELAVCSFWLEHHADIKFTVRELNKLAGLLKLVGVILNTAGQTNIEGEGAVWGWVGVHLKSDPKKSFGTTLEGVADFMFKVTGYASSRLDYCAGVAIQDEARQRDIEIMRLLRLRVGELP